MNKLESGKTARRMLHAYIQQLLMYRVMLVIGVAGMQLIPRIFRLHAHLPHNDGNRSTTSHSRHT